MIGVRLLEPTDNANTPVAQSPPDRQRAMTARDRRSNCSPELERIVRIEIVPRLVLPERRHLVPVIPVTASAKQAHLERIEELAKLVLTRSEEVAFDYVESIRSQGT